MTVVEAEACPCPCSFPCLFPTFSMFLCLSVCLSIFSPILSFTSSSISPSLASFASRFSRCYFQYVTTRKIRRKKKQRQTKTTLDRQHTCRHNITWTDTKGSNGLDKRPRTMEVIYSYQSPPNGCRQELMMMMMTCEEGFALCHSGQLGARDSPRDGRSGTGSRFPSRKR